jgi:endoglucanase
VLLNSETGLLPMGCSVVADHGTLSRSAQCGGIGWTGATCCVTGNACSVINSYYYQCLSATATASSVDITSLCDQILLTN